MLPFQAAHYAKVPTWEGKIAWPYLDTHKNPITQAPAPLVTAGIGCAIDLTEALTLAWTVNGAPATLEQIQAAYAKVESMLPGRNANFYKYPGCIQLTEDAIVGLVQKRYDAFTSELVSLFPDFLTAWPMEAQEGALDLIWGVGEGHPASAAHVATGLGEYTHWNAYAEVHNWAECAVTCAEDPNVHAYDLRNAWRKQLFLDAATAAAPTT